MVRLNTPPLQIVGLGKSDIFQLDAARAEAIIRIESSDDEGKMNMNEHVVDENTSDGFHTFKELYEMRLLLTAAFFTEPNDIPVFRSKRHSDGTIPFGGGWFIVVAELPDGIGQISFHYELKDWDLFKGIPEVDLPPKYDGHTSADVAFRLRKFLGS